jgi:hypothetical protein
MNYEGRGHFAAGTRPSLATLTAPLSMTYVVTDQRPAVGSELRQGIRIPHGIRLTPLILNVELA